MALYKDSNNVIHDDMGGAALSLPAWPAGCVQITEEEAVALTPSPSATIPQSVSRFQARAALHLAGLLDEVEAMMAAQEAPALAKLAWADAQEFERASPTIAAMAGQIGLTDAQLDELFITAAGIKA